MIEKAACAHCGQPFVPDESDVCPHCGAAQTMSAGLYAQGLYAHPAVTKERASAIEAHLLACSVHRDASARVVACEDELAKAKQSASEAHEAKEKAAKALLEACR